MLRIGGVADRTDDRDPARPGGDNVPDVRAVDSADREPRLARVRRRVADELEPDRRAPGLRRRRVDGPDADVVGLG